jgi:FkbM family methyltransferase
VAAVEPQAACARVLDDVYGSDPGVMIVNKAVGDKSGSAEIMIGSVHQTSTMSREWQLAFSQVENPDVTWQATETVQVTTIDELINEFGIPSFVKIDVEGYEHAALQGLSRSVPALSFEFHSYQLNETFACIDTLARLGEVKLNFTLEESILYVLGDWVEPEVVKRELALLVNKPPWYGNVYAKYEIV